MSELLAYIESYFSGLLENEERAAFENRCINDSQFAKEVAFYVSARQAIKEELLVKKQAAWAEAPVVPVNTNQTKPKPVYWIRIAVAACIIAAASVILYMNSNNPRSLASSYIKEHYDDLSMAMSGAADSIELGKQAYKQDDLKRAEMIFSLIVTAHPENAKAKELAGVVYLKTNNYDKAIAMFDELANMKNLYSNPGLMLKASALIMRNKDGDVALAKVLLQQVIEQNMEGKEDAVKWLKKL